MESAATLTLGSMFLARFSTNLQRKIDLINAFKSFFRDDSFKLCSKIAGFLGVLGGRALSEAKGHKVWNLPRPLHPIAATFASKELAQGQLTLIHST